MKKTVLNIFMVMVLTISLTLVSGCGLFNRYERYDDAEKYQIGNFTYDATQINEVEIDWLAGEVVIVKSTNDTLTVTEDEEDLEDSKKLHYYIDGSVLHIHYCASNEPLAPINFGKKVTIEVSDAIDLDVDCISANITVTNLMATDIDLETTSGKVILSDIITTSLSIDVVSGKVELNNVNTTTTDIDSTSGAIEGTNVTTNNLNIDVVSGSVLLKNLNCNNVNVKATSSSVTIETESTDIFVKYKSTTGRFISQRAFEKDDDNYYLGDRTMVINVKTTTGSLTVN